ncbi:hypothetical protein SAMN05443572_115150 [Myxococcus fulvus]|uniref:Zinc-finger domain-containing protein n=1 Tax=Myxococcus fulvus TaxID=33 RepID=A0A511TF17_MYXFU|nr:hypothetical protein [Myxococcus fulvus]GEN11788.1 hypothetical protein MFU01_68250 [Myxococcus fulvus]SEU40515.1 hypothetical protein SAMN05443572_115150 [Myxococcus fulvus]
MKTEAMSRYAARRSQLTDATVPPGVVLEAAGDLLRRATRWGTEGVEAALRGLGRPEVETWLQAQKPQALQPVLLRAAEEAMEVALDGGEEAEVWRASALEGLAARDRAASQAFALAAWEGLHGDLQGDAARNRDRFLESLGSLDALLLPRARWFIPLNPERRQEQALLEPSEQDKAWWFGARAGCDDLVATWTSGPQSPTPHIQGCAECRADIADAAPVDAPPRRHLTRDDLWRFDMGLMTADERERVDAHTARCGECAQAVLALGEGDDAIEEALEMDEGEAGVAPAARSSRAPVSQRPSSARHPEQREVLEERRDFRVVLVRERQRVRLLVQPLAGRTVTAAVFLSPGRPSLKPTNGPEGLSFDLSSASATGARSAHLSVQAGNDTLERDFAF